MTQLSSKLLFVCSISRWFRHESTGVRTFFYRHHVIVGGRWTGSSSLICRMNACILVQPFVEKVKQNTEHQESSRARSSNNSPAGIRHNIGESIQLFGIRETPICENTKMGNSLDYNEFSNKRKRKSTDPIFN